MKIYPCSVYCRHDGRWQADKENRSGYRKWQISYIWMPARNWKLSIMTKFFATCNNDVASLWRVWFQLEYNRDYRNYEQLISLCKEFTSSHLAQLLYVDLGHIAGCKQWAWRLLSSQMGSRMMSDRMGVCETAKSIFLQLKTHKLIRERNLPYSFVHISEGLNQIICTKHKKAINHPQSQHLEEHPNKIILSIESKKSRREQ